MQDILCDIECILLEKRSFSQHFMYIFEVLSRTIYRRYPGYSSFSQLFPKVEMLNMSIKNCFLFEKIP